MKKIFITVLFSINLFSMVHSQDSCEENCGYGTLQEYWNGEVACVCSLDCAGYGDACCDYYEACYENPSNLEFSDFIGTWDGNITNDQTWSYDDPISIVIEENNTYEVTNNAGGHLVSDLYPGTEEVHYNSLTRILTFKWVLYYHYSCGGPCYASVPFQVMDYEGDELTLFYNNGSGPAPQANSMFLSLVGECIDGEIDNENLCNPMECWNGQWYEIIIDCQEEMGFPCEGGLYVSPEDGECCSTCVLFGDINRDGAVDILDAIEVVNLVLNGEYDELVDMNHDGTVNILDIIDIIYIILH